MVAGAQQGKGEDERFRIQGRSASRARQGVALAEALNERVDDRRAECAQGRIGWVTVFHVTEDTLSLSIFRTPSHCVDDCPQRRYNSWV